MINAPFDRSDPRDTTRGGVSLALHAKSSMGGAGMRNTKAWGCVDGLVRTETILMKRLHDLQKRQGAEQEELQAANRRKDGKRLSSESAKSTKSKGAKT